jgi:hypothetical protein
MEGSILINGNYFQSYKFLFLKGSVKADKELREVLKSVID